ncbi:S8 family serine peptidase [Flammeovirga aprica]|uniref:S8 family serine peptidase n=1 Tax=Flammeovirga aprica JL-4 TaxID=694437 RepID=A0A7X9RUU5_9BACT|nr:S8 family serine peptidase [Flammeovirga aprica]NME69120.1 S8 family serine peptidase [Flammeovirga aprica JL-4]
MTIISCSLDSLAQGNSDLILQKYEEHIIRVKLKKDKIDAFTQLNNSSSDQGIITTGDSQLDALNERYGITKLQRVFPYSSKFEEKHRHYGLHLWYEFTFTTDESPDIVAENFSTFTDFEISKPVNRKVLSEGKYTAFEASKIKGFSSEVSMNDPFLSNQWHYHNTGQNNGVVGADISLYDAWEINSGSSNVIVAVMDAGIDVDHIDLEDNIWVNQIEIPNNGVDEDGNGYIDDINGFNFVSNNGDIEAGEHGTHVGGTISAVNNNSIGVAGVAGGNGNSNGVKLMSCMNFANNGSNGGFAQAFVYATDNGAVISQNSWGHTTPSYFDQEILDAIDYFIAEAGSENDSPMKGGIVIFASGNSNDNDLYYPGYYEPILTVASTTNEDQKAYYSNYGDWVDIAAPGGETISNAEKGILSTLPNDTYGYFQGTSMACPHVSGVAALVVSAAKGNMTNTELRSILENAVDDISAQNPLFNGKLGTGRINAYKALQSIKTIGVTPEEIIFNVYENQPQSQKVTVFNISDNSVNFDLTSNSSYFSFDETNVELGIDETKEITITFNPEGFDFGNYKENILFDSNVDFNVDVQINVYEEPNIYVDSVSVNFGEVYQGFTKTRQIEIYNNAFAQLELSAIQSSATSFEIETTSITVPPYGNVFLPVTYSTLNALDENAVLTFSTNDLENTSFSIPLSASIYPNAPPVISTTDSINLKQAESGIITSTFQIENTGTDDLKYSFQPQRNENAISQLTTVKENYYNQAQFEKGDSLYLKGREVVENYGSSTHQFYQWTSQQVTYQWNDIRSKGQNYQLLDEGSTTYAFNQFEFPFFSTLHQSITVFSNGYLQLGNSSSSQWNNTSFPVNDAVNNIIAPYWTDLDSVEVTILEEQNKLVIQYQGQYFHKPESEAKFQVVLHKSGEIDFYYHTITLSHKGTVGLENENAEEGLLIAFNNSFIQNERAIHITPSYFQFSPESGTVISNTNAGVQLSYNSASYFDAGSGNEHSVFIYSNDPSQPLVLLPFTVQYGDVVLALSDTVVNDTSYIGNQYSKEIIIYNNGYENLLISDLTSNIPAILFDETNLTVPSNDSVIIKIERLSEIVENIEGNITFKTNDLSQQNVEIPVSIHNIDYPEVEVTKSLLQFNGYYQRTIGLLDSFIVKNRRVLPLTLEVTVESDTPTPWFTINDSTTLAAFSLDENIEKTLRIEIKENLPTGDYSGKVIIKTNDPFQPQLEIAIELTVNPSPHLSVVEFIHFDQRYIDSTNTFLAVIENIGDEDLNLSYDESNLQFFGLINNTALTLGANEKDTLQFDFNPLSENEVTENLSILTNMADTVPYEIRFSGNGVFEREVEVTERFSTFDIDFNETANGQLNIENTSDHSALYKIVVKEKSSDEVIDRPASTYNDGFNVLILGSGRDEWLKQSVDELYATGRFTSVSGINAFDYTPSIPQIEDFDVILVNGIFGYDNSEKLGNVLHQYIEKGGSVVLSAFVNLESSDQILGLWKENDYDPIEVTNEQLSTKGNGIADNTHPLLDGVNYFDTYNRLGIPTNKIKTDTEVLVSYNDGVPCVLKRNINNKSIFYVNSYTAYWTEGSDGGQLFANVIHEAYNVNAGSSLSWVTSSIPFEGEIGAGQSLDFDFLINEHQDIFGGSHSASLQVYVTEGNYDVLKTTSYIDVNVQATHLISVDSTFVINNERQYKSIPKRITLENKGAGYFYIDETLLSSDKINIEDTDIKDSQINPYTSYYYDITYQADEVGIVKDSITLVGTDGEKVVFSIEGNVVPNGTLSFENTLVINVEHDEKKIVSHTFTNPETGSVDFILSSYYEEAVLENLYSNSSLQTTGQEYSFTSSNDVGGPSFEWIDITTTGTELILGDDESFKLQNLSWDFILYEKHYENIYISSNGYLTFDKENTTVFENEELPNTSKPHSIIAPLWTDLTPQRSGTIHYALDDDKLIVQYTKVSTYDNFEGENTFQVVYWKNGLIQYNYKNVEANEYTIGIENYAGYEGLTIAYNSNEITANTSYHLTPPKRVLVPQSTRFTLEGGGSKEVYFAVNAEDLFYADNFEQSITIQTSNPDYPAYQLDIDFNVLRGIHIKDTIPNQTVELKDSIKIDMTQYFSSSLEDTNINFSVQPNPYLTFKEIDGTLTIIVDHYFDHMQSISVIASQGDISNQQSFSLNTFTDKPYIKKEITDKTLLIGGTYSFNLKDYFGFPTNEEMYMIELEDEAKANYSIEDSILTLQTNHIFGKENGLEVKLIALNSKGSITQIFNIVSYNNRPEGKGDDIVIDIVESESYLLDPSAIYSDRDGHSLLYKVFIPTNTIIKVEKAEGSSFKITPLDKGIASLMFTVDDGYQSINDTINITVEGNYSPVQNITIEDQELILGFTKEIDISNVFVDPEDALLSYEVSTSNENVEAEIEGTSLKLKALEEGKASINIIVSDGEKKSEIAFNVIALNNAVTLIKDIDDVQMYITDEGILMDMDTIFNDVDGHDLSYNIEIDDNSVLSQRKLTGNLYEFIPMEIGEALIVITATDSYSEVSTSFSVNIPNRIPVLLKKMEDQEFYLSDQQQLYIISDYFEDQDQHPLNYSISTTNSDFVTFNLIEKTLEIQFNQAGNGIITVQAEDDYNGSISTSFELTVLEDTIPTSLENSITTQRLDIYPNPVSDRIHFTLANSQKLKMIKLFDVSGQEIKDFVIEPTINSEGNNYTIDVRNLSQGMYFIRIKTVDQNFLSSKFIKK